MDKTLKEFITERLKVIRSTYITDPIRIVKDFNTEQEKISDYNGRQLLEMIQNADDEADVASNREILIRFRDGILQISNNGRPFSKAGIESLMYSNVSPKVNDQNRIGQKGTGFRSILSWAHEIKIRSGSLSVRFSPTHAETFLSALIHEHPHIKEVLKEKARTGHVPIATLAIPEWEEIVSDKSEYDTDIYIKIKAGVEEHIQNQIDSLDKETLLFLNNIDSIVIETPRTTGRFSRNRLDGGLVQVESHFGDDHESILWKIAERNGQYATTDEQVRNFQLKLAYRENLSDTNKLLYSYFKTAVKFPFPAVIHGTFELSANRNQLVESDTNKFLLSELAQLMIDSAIAIASDNPSEPWLPLRLLSIDDESFGTEIEKMGFTEALNDRIRTSAIFPNTNGKYIGLAQAPVYYRSSAYSKFFKGARFERLLMFSPEPRIRSILDRLYLAKFDFDYIATSVAAVASTLTVEARAETISYLLSDYGSQIKDWPAEIPSLFLDEKGQAIPGDAEILLPPEGNAYDLPDFVRIRFLQDELAGALRNHLNVSTFRELGSRLADFKVLEYNSANLIRRLTVQTKHYIETTKDPAAIRQMLHVLWSMFVNEDLVLGNTKVPLIDRDGSIQEAGSLHLGSEYGYSITERLLGKVTNANFAGPPSLLGLTEANIETTCRFLESIGVSRFPRKTLTSEIEPEYFDWALNHLSYPVHLDGGYSFDSPEALRGQLNAVRNCKVETVNDLAIILKSASVHDILIWLWNDESLRRAIISGKEVNADSSMMLDIYRARYSRPLLHSAIPSYLLFLLQEHEWLPTLSGRTVKPEVCCLAKNLPDVFSPFVERPDIDMYASVFREHQIDSRNLEYLLSRLGVVSTLGDLPPATLYNSLMLLPDVDPEAKRAKVFLTEIIRAVEPDNLSCPERDAFLQNGRLPAKFDGQISYHPVAQVYFNEGKLIANEVLNQFPIFILDGKLGNLKVERVFGIKPFSGIEFTITSKPNKHSLQRPFETDYQDLKPYIYALLDAEDPRHELLNRLNNNRIILCRELEAHFEFNNQQGRARLDDFQSIFVRSERAHYLMVPHFISLEDLKRDMLFANALAEVIGIIVRRNSDAIVSKFREFVQANRVNRDRLSDIEIGSVGHQRIQQARHLLGSTETYEEGFWRQLAAAKDRNLSASAEWLQACANTLRQPLDFIAEWNTKISFPLDPNQAELHRVLLRSLKIEAYEFNQHGPHKIELSELNARELRAIQARMRKPFQIRLFDRLTAADRDQQSEFLNIMSQYDNFDEFESLDSVFFNPLEVFISTVRIKFQIDLELDTTTRNPDKEFEVHLTKLKTALNDNKEELRILNEIMQETPWMSLVYFGQLKAIEEEIGQRTRDIPDSQETEQVSTTAKMQQTFRSIMNNSPSVSLTHIPTSEIAPVQKTPVSEERRRKSNRIIEDQARQQEAKVDIGSRGEMYVYKHLCERYGDLNVHWVSEFAKHSGINPTGSDSNPYDLYFTNEDDEVVYVEVKTTSSNEIQFSLSHGQVSYGCQNPKQYQIYLVLNVLDETAISINCINLFDLPDGETFFHNSRYAVYSERYSVEFDWPQPD